MEIIIVYILCNTSLDFTIKKQNKTIWKLLVGWNMNGFFIANERGIVDEISIND